MIDPIGYLYYPETVAAPDPDEVARLEKATTLEVLWDWGSRHQLSQISAGLKQGQISALWVLRLEDLGDNLAECHQMFLQILSANGSLKRVDPNGTVTGMQDPQDWLLGVADLPQKLHSRTMQEVYALQRLAAKPPPGSAPYGYRREGDRYVLDRRPAALVKAFFEHFLIYGSLRESVRHLAQQGKTISVSTGRRWLSHPVYRGDLAFSSGEVIRNTHPPIVSRDEAAQIDRWLKRNRGIPRRSTSAQRALAGLVVCHDCGSLLRIVQVTQPNPSRHSYLYLRCPTCRYSLPYDRVLNGVIDHLCSQLPHKLVNWDPAPLIAHKAQIEAQLARMEQILSQLPELEQKGILDPFTHHHRRHQLQSEISCLLTHLEQFPPIHLPQVAQTLSIRPFWIDLSEIERRRYLREVLHHITAQPDGSLTLSFIFESLPSIQAGFQLVKD